jgi:uncharacterized membrane protein
MAPFSPLAQAALLGASSGARTFSSPAALALHGRLGGGPLGRGALVAAGLGELVIDKLPATPPRVQAPALAGRVASGAISGHRVAGVPGGVLAGLVAGASGLLTYRARGALAERLPVADPVVGAFEDAVALTAVALATRDGAPADGAARAAEAAGRVSAGLAAAAVGTAAMTGAQAGLHQHSDVPAKVGEKLLRRLTGTRVPRRKRNDLNQASLVELPLLGVAEPVWRQPPRTVATDLALHLVYGAAAAVTLRALRRRP